MNLALIPARKGSKRLPGKNKKYLFGKPLICYTIEAVMQSKIFNEIIVSSDDSEILEIASKYNKVYLHHRTKELSSDNISAFDVLNKILDKTADYNVLGLFLPTSPFRNKNDIIRSYELIENNCECVISTTIYKYPPQFALEITENNIAIPAWKDSPLKKGVTQTNNKNIKKLYHPNGAIYMIKHSVYNKTKSFFKANITPYVMINEKSIDIDTHIDFMIAEYLMRKEKK